MAEAAAENRATPVRRGGKMKRVTGMVAMMDTLAIYEQFRAVLGEERAKGFAQTFGTMIEEAKNAATKEDSGSSANHSRAAHRDSSRDLTGPRSKTSSGPMFWPAARWMPPQRMWWGKCHTRPMPAMLSGRHAGPAFCERPSFQPWGWSPARRCSPRRWRMLENRGCEFGPTDVSWMVSQRDSGVS